MEKIRQMEEKIDNVEKEYQEIKVKNTELEEKLDNKLDNYGKLLDKKLANLMLALDDKQKLQTYYKEFNKYLEQNYVAALALASGKIDGQVDSTDYTGQFGNV